MIFSMICNYYDNNLFLRIHNFAYYQQSKPMQNTYLIIAIGLEVLNEIFYPLIVWLI